jgi:hypothetical protein
MDKLHPNSIQVSVSLGAVTTVDVKGDPHFGTGWDNYYWHARNMDAIHIQFYGGLHTTDRSHIGPLAPKKWVKTTLDNIHNAVLDGQGQVQKELASKFIYTMPNYGLAAAADDNIPPTIDHSSLHWAYCSLNAMSNCSTSSITLDKHMETCTFVADPDYRPDPGDPGEPASKCKNPNVN